MVVGKAVQTKGYILNQLWLVVGLWKLWFYQELIPSPLGSVAGCFLVLHLDQSSGNKILWQCHRQLWSNNIIWQGSGSDPGFCKQGPGRITDVRLLFRLSLQKTVYIWSKSVHIGTHMYKYVSSWNYYYSFKRSFFHFWWAFGQKRWKWLEYNQNLFVCTWMCRNMKLRLNTSQVRYPVQHEK